MHEFEKMMRMETSEPSGLPTALEQLLQFKHGPVWDGNVIGKQARDELVEEGLVERARGYNFLTAKGVAILVTLGFLRP